MSALRILLGGGTQQNLARIVSKASPLPTGVKLAVATHDDDPIVWRRKAAAADVAIVRPGRMSHKAWEHVRYHPHLIVVPVLGDDAMLTAITNVCLRNITGATP
jgi:hypothetical protein